MRQRFSPLRHGIKSFPVCAVRFLSVKTKRWSNPSKLLLPTHIKTPQQFKIDSEWGGGEFPVHQNPIHRTLPLHEDKEAYIVHTAHSMGPQEGTLHCQGLRVLVLFFHLHITPAFRLAVEGISWVLRFVPSPSSQG